MTNTPSVPTIKTIAIADIDRDQQTQPREFVNGATVYEYAEDMRNGDEFPPVVVFHDGTKYYLADGFHRVEAYILQSHALIEAEVREGSLRDAIMYSCSANATHGLRRTRQDARRAITRLLKDEEWGKWNASEIARWCSVSPATVTSVRTELEATLQIVKSEKRKVMRDGKEIEVNTSKITGRPRLPWHSHYYAAQKKQGDKPVFMMIGENDSVWVALDTSAVNVAKLLGAATRPIVVNGKWTVGIKLWMGNERRIEQLRGLVGELENYQEPSPELKQMADQVIPTVDFPAAPRPTQFPGMPIPGMPAPSNGSEPATPTLTPEEQMRLIDEVSAECDAAEGIDREKEAEEDASEEAADLARAQALYASTQNGKHQDRPEHPEDFEEWYINGLIARLDEVARFQKMAAQFARTEDQQHLHRWGSKQVEWGPEMANDKAHRLAAHNSTLLEFETTLANATNQAEVNGVLGQLKHYKVGDEKLDRPVEALADAGATKLQELQAA